MAILFYWPKKFCGSNWLPPQGFHSLAKEPGGLWVRVWHQTSKLYTGRMENKSLSYKLKWWLVWPTSYNICRFKTCLTKSLGHETTFFFFQVQFCTSKRKNTIQWVKFLYNNYTYVFEKQTLDNNKHKFKPFSQLKLNHYSNGWTLLCGSPQLHNVNQ